MYTWLHDKRLGRVAPTTKSTFQSCRQRDVVDFDTLVCIAKASCQNGLKASRQVSKGDQLEDDSLCNVHESGKICNGADV